MGTVTPPPLPHLSLSVLSQSQSAVQNTTTTITAILPQHATAVIDTRLTTAATAISLLPHLPTTTILATTIAVLLPQILLQPQPIALVLSAQPS